MTDQPLPGIRERNRVAIEAEILRVGRAQLARVGAAALSLRAVARELGMVSSGIYRYVASRDDLLTRLIVRAYDDLGDAVDSALAGRDEATAGERFAVLCRTVRGWALANPHDYALLYGSPVPEYHAPAELTVPAGTRVQAHLVRILADGDPGLPTRDREALGRAGAALAPTLADPFFADGPHHPEVLVRGLAAWSLVLGAISAELFEQLGPDTVADAEAHFEAMVTLAGDLVLRG